MNVMTLVKKITVAILMMAPAMGCAMAETGKSNSVEYYQSFAGLDLPLRLINKTTKEEAEAQAGNASHYIAYFDGEGNLVRVVKMFRGSMLFEHSYTYYQNGKLMRAEIKSDDGNVRVHEFDTSGALKK